MNDEFETINIFHTEQSEVSLLIDGIKRFFTAFRMTKLKVLLSASSLAAGRTKHGLKSCRAGRKEMNEPMTLQIFVIGEFISGWSHEAWMKICRAGRKEMNEPMTLQIFVIGEFISGWSHEAWIKIMPCWSQRNERANDIANIE